MICSTEKGVEMDAKVIIGICLMAFIIGGLIFLKIRHRQ